MPESPLANKYTTVSKVSYYNPFLLFGLALFTLGAGLYTTFEYDTDEGKWIGYQVLAGVGFAFIVQVVNLPGPLFSTRRRRTC